MKAALVVLLVCVASSYAQTLDFSAILNQIVPLAQDAIQQAINAALGQLSGLLGKRSLPANIQNALQSVQNLLNSGAADLQQTVADLLAQYGSQLQSFLGSLGKRSDIYKMQALSAQVKGDLTDAFNALLDQALGHITDIATNLANLGLATIVSGLNGKRFLESLGLGDAFNNILSGLTSTVTNVTSSVTDIYGQLVDAVTPHVQDLQDQLVNHGLNAAQSLLDTLANISGTIGRK
jgi:uncharacterized protein YicC (UPF0701 family)